MDHCLCNFPDKIPKIEMPLIVEIYHAPYPQASCSRSPPSCHPARKSKTENFFYSEHYLAYLEFIAAAKPKAGWGISGLNTILPETSRYRTAIHIRYSANSPYNLILIERSGTNFTQIQLYFTPVPTFGREKAYRSPVGSSKQVVWFDIFF